MARGRIRTALGTGTLAVLVGWAALAAPQATPVVKRVTLSPTELREAATGALKAGHPEIAYRYSDALVKRDATDRTALLIRARAARDLGQYDNAKQSAKAAWKQAETPEDKFSTSMIMAQTLSSAGQRTMAQLWLRRAAQHAPTEALENRAIRDFRYVRSRNPWNTQFSFAITPDSNVNNGTSEKYLSDDPDDFIGSQTEFSANSRPIPGMEIALGASTRYRFRETETHANDLTFSTRFQHYVISSSDKRRLRTVEGNDYDFGYYEFGYAHRGKNREGRGEYRLFTTVGQNWYGGEEYSRYVDLAGGQTFYLENYRSIRVNLSARRTFGVTRSDLDEVNASVSYRFPIGTSGILSTSLNASIGESPNNAGDSYEAIGARAWYRLTKPVLGARASFSVSARSKVHDDYVHGVLIRQVGREDMQYTADFLLVFDQIDYYGFNPTMRVSASRTDSNVTRLQAERFGINFGIQSAF
ncbi:surface lipoprotein assembly modifier [Rhodobacteraceae bacterium M382]|nr:surface lipoprotein assembly modifier [Rhodobacteraceae bacterium M382]